MRSSICTFTVFSCFSLLAVSAQALEPDQAAKIAAKLGSSIHSANITARGSKVHGSRATAVIDAPIADVERVVFDYARYNHFLPHLTKSKVLSRRGNNAIAYFEAEIAKGAIPARWVQMRLMMGKNKGATRVLNASMTKGNLRTFDARWYLTPMAGGGKTLVAFEMVVDPKLPSVFSGLIGSQVEKAARKTLSRLRKRAGRAYRARRKSKPQSSFVRGNGEQVDLSFSAPA